MPISLLHNTNRYNFTPKFDYLLIKNLIIIVLQIFQFSPINLFILLLQIQQWILNESKSKFSSHKNFNIAIQDVNSTFTRYKSL